MTREIYEVYAKVVDANGAYNTLSGYPKVFDSRSYDGNIDTAYKRAEGEWHTCLGAMSKRDDRQKQFAMVIRASDGVQVLSGGYGRIADDPDPAPPEEEPDVPPEEEPEEE